MTYDTQQDIPMPSGGCRLRSGPYPGGDPSGETAFGRDRWIYGAPQPGPDLPRAPDSGEETAPVPVRTTPAAGGEGAVPAVPGTTYGASLRSLLDRTLGRPIVATFQVGSGQTVTWQGVLQAVGSDYLLLYQPDHGRYVSCDLGALKFVQFHGAESGPYYAGDRDGG